MTQIQVKRGKPQNMLHITCKQAYHCACTGIGANPYRTGTKEHKAWITFYRLSMNVDRKTAYSLLSGVH